MKNILTLILFLTSFQLVSAQNLKVMSYNIRHGSDAQEQNNLEEMAKFMLASGADIIGLQEVDSVCRRSGNVDQMKRLAALTGMHYGFIRHYAYDGGAYGLGVLSKYPIVDIQNSRLSLLKPTARSKNTGLLSAIIEVPKLGKIIFSTAHFGLDAPTRVLQANETISLLKSNRMPVIFTGDLNAEPATQEIEVLKKYFTDTDPSNQFTFPVDVPKKRIDYILVSTKFLKEVKSYQVFENNKLSDHLPLMAEIEFVKK